MSDESNSSEHSCKYCYGSVQPGSTVCSHCGRPLTIERYLLEHLPAILAVFVAVVALWFSSKQLSLATEERIAADKALEATTAASSLLVEIAALQTALPLQHPRGDAMGLFLLTHPNMRERVRNVAVELQNITDFEHTEITDLLIKESSEEERADSMSELIERLGTPSIQQ